MNAFASLCPADCDVVQFPAIDQIQDCTSFNKYLSEVCEIILLHNDGTLPTDWTVQTDWEAIVDNDTVDANAAKWLVGIGNIPAPEETERDLPKGRTVVTRRTYTLTFRVFNMNDAHYEFLRKLQCGDTDFRFWFNTRGGTFFGGATGIRPKKANAQLPLEEGEDSYQVGTVVIDFEALVDPPRTYFNNLSENFANGSVTPTAATVWGSSSTSIWGSSSTAIWGAG